MYLCDKCDCTSEEDCGVSSITGRPFREHSNSGLGMAKTESERMATEDCGPELMKMGKAAIWAEYLRHKAAHACYAAKWQAHRQEYDWDQANHFFGKAQGLFDAYCLSV